jgi:hypothetical protein
MRNIGGENYTAFKVEDSHAASEAHLEDASEPRVPGRAVRLR